MKIVFRTDASLQIGSGHVIRCLTLADALFAEGLDCSFICREHSGNLIETIRQRGYAVMVLPTTPTDNSWLGCSWEVDAEQTQDALGGGAADWLVVDHYALDESWETALSDVSHKLLVIDDLADRHHCCDVLLDQNLGRREQDYIGLVPDTCKILVGPQYALLRPEFASLREASLQRRQQPALKKVLITMGGVDQFNATGEVLQALCMCALPQDCSVSVVMGLRAPWLDQVRALAREMPWPTEVLVNIKDMAQCMVESDFAIGAAGSTSWERCCLGLPTILVVLAENQRSGARALQQAQSACLLGTVDEVKKKMISAVKLMLSDSARQRMSVAASLVTDGMGTKKVMQMLGVK